jgi:putative transposase
MVFNADVHHRRSIRLRHHDYGHAGAYFFTLCVRDRTCRFGEIVDGILNLSPLGEIAVQEWHKLALRWPQLILDAFVVMPNHVHGIFWLSNIETSTVGAPLAGALNDACTQSDNSVGKKATASIRATARVAPTVGQVIGAYKSLVFQQCLAWANNTDTSLGKLWQRNYWERVVRNEQELNALREYIHNNPMSWELDSLNRGLEDEL